MANRWDNTPDPMEGHETRLVSTDPNAASVKRRLEKYRPSRVFRRVDKSPAKDLAAQSSLDSRTPGLLTLSLSVIFAGAAAGFAEVFVRRAQVDLLHRVAWGSLMISKHAIWMVPAITPIVMIPVMILLVSPVLAWAIWRNRKSESSGAGVVRLAWGWAGMVLGGLCLFGPLTAIDGLHPAAPVALAIGGGFRLRRWFVRPTIGWQRLSRIGAGLAIVIVSSIAFFDIRRDTAVASPILTAGKPAAGAPNLIWIVLDTLRADRMSLHGYGRPTTPALDAWSREAITFDRARSAAPWTLPSHVTMFTGLWPFEHGAGVDRPYHGAAPTLAEHLRGQGYRTGGVVANVRMCNSAYGVGRGFDHYIDYPFNREISLRAMMCNSVLGSVLVEIGRRMLLPIPGAFPFDYSRRAPKIIADGQRWLEESRSTDLTGSPNKGQPFFLFLNLMDVHGPYLPPEGTRRFGTGPVPRRNLASPASGWKAEQALMTAGPEAREQRQRELDEVRNRLGDLYDDCLVSLDAELGRTLQQWRAQGLLANTWVVITADHGEHFGEHECFGHGSSLYNEQTHVPLMLIPPLSDVESKRDPYAALRGRRIGVPVTHRDLPTTMAQLLMPGANHPFPGLSLSRFWTTAELGTDEPIFSQLEEPHFAGDDFSTNQVTSLNSVIEDDYILIESGQAAPELYHLLEDPKQQRNLAGIAAEHPRLERLQSRLRQLKDASKTGEPAGKRP